MATKNLIINNELGSFTFNEESLKALEDFMVYALPLMNDDLAERIIKADDDLEKSYAQHIDNDIRPLVQNIYNILHYSR